MLNRYTRPSYFKLKCHGCEHFAQSRRVHPHRLRMPSFVRFGISTALLGMERALLSHARLRTANRTEFGCAVQSQPFQHHNTPLKGAAMSLFSERFGITR